MKLRDVGALLAVVAGFAAAVWLMVEFVPAFAP